MTSLKKKIEPAKVELTSDPRFYMIQRGDDLVFYRWDEIAMRYVELNKAALGPYATAVYNAARLKRLRFFI